MAILRERQVWRRAAAKRRKSRASLGKLSPEEAECVRVAVRALRVRLGSWRALSESMGVSEKWIEKLMGRKGEPSAGLALCAARLAGVPVDDVLSGAFPKPGSCPMCGRCGV